MGPGNSGWRGPRGALALALLLLPTLGGLPPLAGKGGGCDHDSCRLHRPARPAQPPCHSEMAEMAAVALVGEHGAHGDTTDSARGSACTLNPGCSCGHSHAAFASHRDSFAVLAPSVAGARLDRGVRLAAAGDAARPDPFRELDSPPPRPPFAA